MQEKKQTFMAQTQADKQLRRALISMIASIVLCLGCLIGTTWAWFETSITNEGNVITIAEMQVSVTMHKGEASEYKNLVATDQYTYELDEVGTYSIVLINTGDIPGYCTIRLKHCFHNKQRNERWNRDGHYETCSPECFEFCSLSVDNNTKNHTKYIV